MDFKTTGLTTAEVELSEQKYGKNALSRKKQKTILQMFFDSFSDFWIKVLGGTLVAKFLLLMLGVFLPQFSNDDIFHDIVEIIGIAIAILLSTISSTVSEYKNTSRGEALHEEYSKTFAKVYRNGQLLSILTTDIVKGD